MCCHGNWAQLMGLKRHKWQAQPHTSACKHTQTHTDTHCPFKIFQIPSGSLHVFMARGACDGPEEYCIIFRESKLEYGPTLHYQKWEIMFLESECSLLFTFVIQKLVFCQKQRTVRGIFACFLRWWVVTLFLAFLIVLFLQGKATILHPCKSNIKYSCRKMCLFSYILCHYPASSAVFFLPEAVADVLFLQ